MKKHQEKRKELEQARKKAQQAPKIKEDIQKLTEENARLNETVRKLQEKIDTETLNEIKEQKAELERQNAEDRAVINEENTSPSENTAAEERVAQRKEEIGQLTTQIEGMEREKPLREKIKNIFKKHGVTLTAILLAAGVTIGSVIGVIKSALTKTGKSLGNGLKEIGKKTASLLPGLLGSIVSFLFKAAGQAIGFLTQCQEQQPCNRNRANCKSYFVVVMCLTA